MDKKLLDRIKQGDAGVMVVLSASDLKAVVGEMCQKHETERAKAIEAQQEPATMTRHAASRALNVTLATLWRWAKIGYLTPVKIGSKVLYRTSDIEALLTKKGE